MNIIKAEYFVMNEGLGNIGTCLKDSAVIRLSKYHF